MHAISTIQAKSCSCWVPFASCVCIAEQSCTCLALVTPCRGQRFKPDSSKSFQEQGRGRVLFDAPSHDFTLYL